jgi:hypothetical protein
MENLRLTHEQWYSLPLWERETWLAREADKEEQYKVLFGSLKLQGKNTLNPHGLNAAVLLQAMMV